MSATVAQPDSTAAATTAAPSIDQAESELETYYASIEGRGDETPSGGGASAAPTTTTASTASAVAAPATVDTPAATATAAGATPPAATTSEWDTPDDDPALPPSLRGKTRREVYDSNKRALSRSYADAQAKNDFERRALVAEAIVKTIQEDRARSDAATPKTPPPPAPKPHELFNLPDRESSFGAVPDIVDQLPGVIDQRAGEIAAKRIKPLEEQVAAMQQAATALQRERDWALADQVRTAATRAAGIPDDMVEPLKFQLASIMQANNLHPHNAEHWTWAVNQYRSNAAKLVPQVVSGGAPPASPTGNRTAAATAPAATQRKFASTGDRKTDEMLDELLDDYKLPKDGYRERVVKQLRDARMTEA